MSAEFCVWFNKITRDDVQSAGGKGANLGDLVQAGLPVPPGFVITSSAYRYLIEKAGLGDRIKEMLQEFDRHSNEKLQDSSSQIRELFADVTIPDDLVRSILEHYRQLGESVMVAVRSSATAEDLAGASFAGQQDTILNVKGEDALLKAVRRCWASLFNSQAIFYRDHYGFDSRKVSMAVVVQKMVNSEKSGVSFTVDPVMHNHYAMIIEAVWGLGEGVVSGQITPDHYKVDRETYELLLEFVPDKPFMFCKGAGKSGVVKVPTSPDKVSARVLTDDELHQLVDLGNKVEDHFGCPQDIEWGIEDGTIYLLQSRPITSL